MNCIRHCFHSFGLGLIVVISLSLISETSQANDEVSIEAPGVVFTGETYPVPVNGFTMPPGQDTLILEMGAQRYHKEVGAGQSEVNFDEVMASEFGSSTLRILTASGDLIAESRIAVIEGWMSLLPPVIAIVIALLLRSVIPALFLGIWLGATLISGPTIYSTWAGFLNTFQVHIVNAIADPDRVQVILFTLMLGGMVGILSKNGGMQAIVAGVTRYASSPRRGQLITAGLGTAVFFDDVANTLLIGKTMQPVIDKLRISRQKLAYLVDSTAAPIAGIAFATTWIGYEVSVIKNTVAEIPGFNESAYSIFLASLPYSFYPLLCVFTVFAVVLSGRDVGPMYTAEKQARSVNLEESKGDSISDKQEGNQVLLALNAIVPVSIVILTLISGLYITGSGDNIREILGSADSYKVLMWAAFLGVMSALVLSVVTASLSLEKAIDAWLDGVKITLFAIIVLILSWTLSDVTQALDTPAFLMAQLGDALPFTLLPAISFLLAGVIAFTTGTSWGTMGILMPLILPLSWSILAADVSSHMYIIYAAVAGVLAGAIWGDHCSPISDTTVLSSLASGCDHIEHVRTQLPYALLSGACAIFLCAIPVGFGAPSWLCLLVSCIVILILLKRFGKKVDSTVT